MVSEDKIIEALELFVYNVSSEGIAYAIENYPPNKDTPEDLREAAEVASKALSKVKNILEKYMDKFDLEFS